MKKSPRRVVIYTEEVYRKMVDRCFNRFPNETGGFLLASMLDNDIEVFPILDLYHSRFTKANRESWTFREGCVLSANKAASRKNMVMVGMYHSHPWTNIVPGGVAYQSHPDAEIQERHNFRLSIIVGISKGRFTTSVWRMGFAAPYTQYIFPTGSNDAVPLDKYYQERKDDPFWSRSFGLLSAEEKLSISWLYPLRD